MTLKEKVMQKQPEKVSEIYTGGVSACPADYPYLNDGRFLNDHDGVTGNCTAANEEKCAECWNREFVPAVNATKHGKWINAYDTSGGSYYKCSKCACYIEKIFFANDYAVNFCPSCGAKMDKE